ncbi:MAG: carbonic anhydrase [Deltaproteobacteria bacterium]|nr:carbonic anhydrase [Deltaproteobacteria bacterium]
MIKRETRKLVEGNLRFQSAVFEPQRESFEELLSGQAPRALYVGCSDSRVVAEMILDVVPGELFVVRNIGAIVPHAEDPSATSLGAALDYAINVLGVPDIVVCGHDLCGALGAIVEGTAPRGSHLERWLRKGSTEVEGFDLLDHTEEMTREQLVERFIATQLKTLTEYETVRLGLEAGRLGLHGAVYDPRSGRLRVAMPGSHTFIELKSPEQRSTLLPVVARTDAVSGAE